MGVRGDQAKAGRGEEEVDGALGMLSRAWSVPREKEEGF